MKRRFNRMTFQAAASCLLFAALPVALTGSLGAHSRGGAESVSYPAKDPTHREAQKAMRAGKYEKAAQVYERLVE
ncbi:MAG TPA: hypothetical protein VLG74_02165, partial [Blastocatellia bacterium]|nr:hypothetical protein [Blastocatellia bacterium]